MTKTLRDIQSDAAYLHAMAQGVEELFEIVECAPTPASNSLNAIIRCLTEKADALANEIDRLETENRKQVAA